MEQGPVEQIQEPRETQLLPETPQEAERGIGKNTLASLLLPFPKLPLVLAIG